MTESYPLDVAIDAILLAHPWWAGVIFAYLVIQILGAVAPILKALVNWAFNRPIVLERIKKFALWVKKLDPPENTVVPHFKIDTTNIEKFNQYSRVINGPSAETIKLEPNETRNFGSYTVTNVCGTNVWLGPAEKKP